MLTFTILSLLGTGNAGAVPHAKNTAKNKTNHARPAAQGTRLFATGAVDPATSTVKAITADNRFTWIRLTPTTLVIQGGKRITSGVIGEGDKLLCRGIWMNDAWGPVFQARQVEVIGSIGDTGLQAKVAAACQHVAQNGPAEAGGSAFSHAEAGGSPPSQADDVAVDQQRQDLQDYLSALNDRTSALEQAKQALSDARDQCEGSELSSNIVERRYVGDNRDLKKIFDQAQQDFDTAVDRLGNITPVPSTMSRANAMVTQSCTSYHQFSQDVQDDYIRLSLGHEERVINLRILKEWNNATSQLNEAVAEAGRAAHNHGG